MIAFFLTPIGRYLAIAIIAIAVLGGVYYNIRSSAVAEYEAKATQDALQRTDDAIAAGDAVARDPAGVRDDDKFERH
jgi:hypothetical protein